MTTLPFPNSMDTPGSELRLLDTGKTHPIFFPTFTADELTSLLGKHDWALFKLKTAVTHSSSEPLLGASRIPEQKYVIVPMVICCGHFQSRHVKLCVGWTLALSVVIVITVVFGLGFGYGLDALSVCEGDANIVDDVTLVPNCSPASNGCSAIRASICSHVLTYMGTLLALSFVAVLVRNVQNSVIVYLSS